jgi:hypothetical protein
LQVSEGVLGTKFFLMGPEVKKQDVIATQNASTLSRLFSVLKIELKT